MTTSKKTLENLFTKFYRATKGNTLSLSPSEVKDTFTCLEELLKIRNARAARRTSKRSPTEVDSDAPCWGMAEDS
jgi:hypothetical protein